MTINLVQIIVIIIIAGLCYYANENLNNVPGLKQIIKVLIVVISVLVLLSALGLIGNSANIVIK